MDASLPFDADLLRRYDRPGPRYTSYPTAPRFDGSFGEAQLREAAAAQSSPDVVLEFMQRNGMAARRTIVLE